MADKAAGFESLSVVRFIGETVEIRAVTPLNAIHFVGESVQSGFLVAAPENQVGVPVSAPGATVLRITFTHPGTYHYICALHDDIGMVGKVIVK